MKVDDRSSIAEHLIFQLWQKNYFSTIPIQTVDGRNVTILSTGILNQDSGPDFKNISIKVEDQIFQGDLEIHRAPEDWYTHQHHADPNYNNVVMHLVIGAFTPHEPPVRLNRLEVDVQVFTEISPEQFDYLAKKFKINVENSSQQFFCQLSQTDPGFKLQVIDHLGRQRLEAKAYRFNEQRVSNSWNQILYVGIMEALGYSKNQIPFRKLAQLLPFEALMREFQHVADANPLFKPLALLLGVAGLLPSQDPSFDWKKVKDEETRDYVTTLEAIWGNYADRLGLNVMGKGDWQFFRMRPNNFPTRRLAGASLILRQFIDSGILEKLLKLTEGMQDNLSSLIKEFERLFICKTDGYWATHYLLDNKPDDLPGDTTVTLIGKDRAREIVVNIILPVMLAYAREIENSALKIQIMQLYSQYPKISSNSVIKKMSHLLFALQPKMNELISTAMKQQGLIHLYKLHCHRKECERCKQDWQTL